jgi:hypothetical protein
LKSIEGEKRISIGERMESENVTREIKNVLAAASVCIVYLMS